MQYLQMKWPLLDVPAGATLKDSRSPSPAHLVRAAPHHHAGPRGEPRSKAGHDAGLVPAGVFFWGGIFWFSPSHVLPLAAPQSNKVPVVQHAHHMHPLTPLITYSNDHFSPGSPPGHLSPEIDPKTGEEKGGWVGAGGGEGCREGAGCWDMGAGREMGAGRWVLEGRWVQGGSWGARHHRARVLTLLPLAPRCHRRNPAAAPPARAAPLLPAVARSRGPDPSPAGLARAAVRMGSGLGNGGSFLLGVANCEFLGPRSAGAGLRVPRAGGRTLIPASVCSSSCVCRQGQPVYSIPPGGFRHPYPALAMNASMSRWVPVSRWVSTSRWLSAGTRDPPLGVPKLLQGFGHFPEDDVGLGAAAALAVGAR